MGFGFSSVKLHCGIKPVPTLQTAVVCGREASRGWQINPPVLIPEDKTGKQMADETKKEESTAKKKGSLHRPCLNSADSKHTRKCSLRREPRQL